MSASPSTPTSRPPSRLPLRSLATTAFSISSVEMRNGACSARKLVTPSVSQAPEGDHPEVELADHEPCDPLIRLGHTNAGRLPYGADADLALRERVDAPRELLDRVACWVVARVGVADSQRHGCAGAACLRRRLRRRSR